MPDQETALEPDLKAVQARIVDRQYAAALTQLTSLLERNPDNTEALYMQAVCERYLGQHEQALVTLGRLKILAPTHGRAYQEEGHNLRQLGRDEAAIRAYSLACQHNPSLEASFRFQLELLDKLGHTRQAALVRAQLEYLRKLPKPLVAVTDLISESRLLKAEELCRAFLQKVPGSVDGMRLLADIGIRLGVLDDAEYLLESAVVLAPDNIQARIEYIQALRKRQKFLAALEQAKHLLDTAPDNPQFQSIYAVEAMQAGDFDTALEMFDRVLERLPDDAVTLTSRGHALKTRGDQKTAVASYQAALKSSPAHGEAYYSLANLKVYNFSDEEMAAMQKQTNNPDLAPQDRTYLNFALGKAYEDRNDFDTSFHYYARGNQVKKAQSNYDARRMSEELHAMAENCDTELFRHHVDSGCQAPDPIFIVGLPRAGSTLLEQILSSHSQVDGTLELPNILSLAQRLRRRGRSSGNPGFPQLLHDLDAEELRQFGEEYIRDTAIHRQKAPLFVDKMPNNFRYIGLIRLILPNAKIIDARRNPMACCFSGYKQLFAEGQEFSYSLKDIGHYYRDYLALMAHWDRVLPGFVLRVYNEDVIEDLETQVRRMLDFCDLPFEEACLDYHTTQRNVRTPSSEQVRQPPRPDGINQWRHFEKHLSPLKEALEPALQIKEHPR